MVQLNTTLYAESVLFNVSNEDTTMISIDYILVLLVLALNIYIDGILCFQCCLGTELWS